MVAPGRKPPRASGRPGRSKSELKAGFHVLAVWVINLPPDGRLELVLGEGRGIGKSVRLKSGAPISKNEWIHLAAVVDRKAAVITWYVNGKPDGSCGIPESMTGELHGGKSPISIPSSHKPFNGAVRDFRIYGCALESGRIGKLCRRENERYHLQR